MLVSSFLLNWKRKNLIVNLSEILYLPNLVFKADCKQAKAWNGGWLNLLLIDLKSEIFFFFWDSLNQLIILAILFSWSI